MNPDHAHFAEWDAAYVLGALSSSDRRAYEAHLETCDSCRRAVAELGPTVGLLSRIKADQVLTLSEESGPDASLRDGVVSLARERRARRRRRMWIGSVAAAAVLVIAAIAIPVTISSVSQPPPAFALEDVSGAPLEASVRLTQVAWGTKIEIECQYTDAASSSGSVEGRPYALAVVGEDGVAETVSTWRALPGKTARVMAGTAMDAASIRSVEIRAVSDGRVLMRYDVGTATG